MVSTNILTTPSGKCATTSFMTSTNAAEQALAADGATALFSSSLLPLSLNSFARRS
jgi:hypothetical protein